MRHAPHKAPSESDRSQSDPRLPEVSFIVAALNTAPYVEAAITSALQQADVSVEVIVADDGSTDQTASIVADLAAREPRLTLLRQDRTQGASAARNAAIAVARGAWIAILDADDLVTPDRSRRLLDLAAATSADIVADNFERFVGDDPTPVSTMLDERPGPYAFLVDAASFLRGNTMFDRKARLGYIKPMIRSAFLEAKALRYDDGILIGEDYHLLMECLLQGARFVVASDRCYKYRMRPGSLSWRLQVPHVRRLLEAHEALQIETRFGDDAELRSAAQGYAGALRKAELALTAIDDAKGGRWQRALMSAAARPEAWPILLRFASEAAGKRLTRARR
jgi:succinoglycan biosynthesis protein ExoO